MSSYSHLMNSKFTKNHNTNNILTVLTTDIWHQKLHQKRHHPMVFKTNKRHKAYNVVHKTGVTSTWYLLESLDYKSWKNLTESDINIHKRYQHDLIRWREVRIQTTRLWRSHETNLKEIRWTLVANLYVILSSMEICFAGMHTTFSYLYTNRKQEWKILKTKHVKTLCQIFQNKKEEKSGMIVNKKTFHQRPHYE